MTIIMIGVASNLDNLGIGLSYGIKSTKILFRYNLMIALISLLAAMLSLSVGSTAAHYVPLHDANFGGGLLICFIGLWTVLTNGQWTSKEEEKENVAYSGKSVNIADAGDAVMTFKEAFLLGIGLALNGMAIGLGAGASGVSPWLAAVSIGVFSLISVDIGVRSGKKISSIWIGRFSNLIAGLLLIVIGFYEIWN